MYYDLNLSYSDAEAALHRERICSSLSLGYNTVASASTVAERLSTSNKCSINHVDDTSIASGGVHLHRQLQLGGSFRPGKEGHVVLKQLTRLNFVATDPSQTQQLSTNQQVLKTYDLVCVVPRSERVLQQACNSLDIDVICIELWQRLPFKLKPNLLKPALSRGIYFEICYAPALREPSARRHLFANAQALIRATRGSNIIISSGARLASELRAPHDVINLASLFGMSLKDAKAAVSTNPREVVERAHIRRNYYKGAVRVLEEQQRAAAGGRQPMDVDQAGHRKAGQGQGGRGQQQQLGAAAAVGSKRKMPMLPA